MSIAGFVTVENQSDLKGQLPSRAQAIPKWQRSMLICVFSIERRVMIGRIVSEEVFEIAQKQITYQSIELCVSSTHLHWS